MKCPRCEAEVEGRFCGYCGAPLQPGTCPSCSADVPPGHRFCGVCGTEQIDHAASQPIETSGATAGAAARPRASTDAPATDPDAQRRWWIAGAALAGALLFLAVPYVWTGWTEGGGGERVPMGAQQGMTGGQQGAPGMGGAPNVDLSSMTPRQAADRLYNRVMTAMGAGEDAEVQTFLPMAIDAYQLVPDLDADGHFHLSLLQQAGGDPQAGLETAESVLADQPDHLLALYAAGEAAREMGQDERAREHHGHLLEVFDEESLRDLPEYREHASFLPTMQQVARDYLAGS